MTQHNHACELGLKGTGMFSESLYTRFTKLLAFRYLPHHSILTNGPNDVKHIVWAHYPCLHVPSQVSHTIRVIYS